MKTVYLAGPFRGANAYHVHQNVGRAEAEMFEVIHEAQEQGLQIAVFCPHTMTSHLDGTFDGDYWLEATMEWLIRSDSVLMLEDWEKSQGARGEHNRAILLRKPVFYHVPGLMRWLQKESQG